jgi:hypothetical protein
VGITADGMGGFTSQLNIGRASGADADSIALSVVPDQPVVGSPTPSAQWDRYLETVTVLYDAIEGRWDLWYLGYSALGFVSPGIGQMQSLDADGTSWRRATAPLYTPSPSSWDSALISGPSVLAGPDRLYRLYYTGVSMTSETGIGLLTSPDKTRWTADPRNPVFGHGPPGAWDENVVEPTVRYHAGRYWLYYSGYQGALSDTTSIAIGLATSDDGIRWQRHAGNPVLRPGALGSWNDLRVLAPDVAIDADGSFVMAAYGQSRADPANQKPGFLGLWRSR